MSEFANSAARTVRWKSFSIITAESLLSFYLATFSMGMYFSHHGSQWLIASVIISLLYLFVIIFCIQRIVRQFSLAALMLLVPIAPLIILIIVVTLIPILEKLH